MTGSKRQINNWVQKSQLQKGDISTTAWSKYKASFAIPCENIHGWVIATSQRGQPLLNPFWPPPSSDIPPISLIHPIHSSSSSPHLTASTYFHYICKDLHTRKSRQKSTHSKGEEEEKETRRTAKDGDARLIDGKGNLQWLYFYIHSGKQLDFPSSNGSWGSYHQNGGRCAPLPT